MRVPVYIALAGKRFSGKDYVADQLTRTLGGTSTRLAFGDALKHAFSQHHGIPLAHLYDREHKEPYRQALIAWGKARFVTDGDVFCRIHEAHARRMGWPVVIIPDLRFAHEMQHLRAHATLFVRIEADEATRQARGWVFDPVADDGASETEMDDYVGWDHTIKNVLGNSLGVSHSVLKICEEAGKLWSLLNPA